MSRQTTPSSRQLTPSSRQPAPPQENKPHESPGWLEGVRLVPSPNCDARPDVPVDLLVIHNISLPPGEFGGGFIEDFFCNNLNASAHPYFANIASMKVSAHFLIARDGAITQFVPMSKRAWHAGVSNFEGRERCNDFSIGIELEGTDHLPFSDSQYRSLALLTQRIRQSHPLITAERITGHSVIAPARKTDPGQFFDWEKYLALLQ